MACVKSLVKRTGIDPQEIEDVLMGNTQQTKEQGLNVGRTIGLMAGLPVEAGGATINRLCGSSLQALNQAAHAVMAGFENVQIVGGLEHMQHLPMDHGLDLNPKLFHRTSKGALLMGVTAEFLAQTQGISREGKINSRCAATRLPPLLITTGEFANEIVPVLGNDEDGKKFSSLEINAFVVTPASKPWRHSSPPSCRNWEPSLPETVRH